MHIRFSCYLFIKIPYICTIINQLVKNMKKIIYAATLPLMLAACNGNIADNYTVTGNLAGDANGKTAYLVNYDTGDKIDSAVVDSAKFVFTGHIDTPILARVVIDGQRGGTFVLEAGNISYDAANRKVSGTALNDALTSFANAQLALINEFRNLTPDTPGLDSIQNVINGKYEALTDSAIAANKDNILGYMLFLNKAYEFSATELDSALNASPAFYKEGKRIKDLLDSHAKVAATAPGKMFTDFEVVYNDSTYRFSDYVGKGKFVLVDFWASWCGPCMKELEVIKELYSKYHDKGLEVLGVAVWDEPEASLATIEAKQLPWQNIINAQKIPTDIYGIMGIPHLILIAPDGTIVNRGMQGDALRAEVKKVMEPDTDSAK